MMIEPDGTTVKNGLWDQGKITKWLNENSL